MNIEFISLSDTELCVKPTGRIDTITAVEFGTTVDEKTDDIKKLTLDFSNVEYVSSMGLRILLELQRKMNAQGSMVLTNVSPDIVKVFEITGFNKILHII